MAEKVMAEHDDAEEASGQCARACGALTRVCRACLWRAQQAVPTSTDPMGILKNARDFTAPGAGKEHTRSARRRPRSWRQKARLQSRSADSTLEVPVCVALFYY